MKQISRSELIDKFFESYEKKLNVKIITGQDTIYTGYVKGIVLGDGVEKLIWTENQDENHINKTYIQTNRIIQFILLK